MVHCPECGKLISREARRCPGCGKKVNHLERVKKVAKGAAVIGGLALATRWAIRRFTRPA